MTQQDQWTADDGTPGVAADPDEGKTLGIHRRTLLGAVGSGSTVALAGCLCDSDHPIVDLSVEISEVSRRDGGWRTTADVTVAFSGEDKGDLPVTDLAIGAYDPGSTTVLDEAAVGTVQWEDVPASERSSSRRCPDTGSLAQTVTLDTANPPYVVGPRVLDWRSFVSSTCFHEGIDGVTGSRYTGETDASAWPPTTVDAGTYEQVETDELPWPRPDLTTVDSADGFSDVDFRVAPNCWDPERREPEMRIRDGRLQLWWGRRVPVEPEHRPYLEALSRSGSTVEVTVGFQAVPYLPQRERDVYSYEISATITEHLAETVDRAVVSHPAVDEGAGERITIFA